jgi:6-phosphogluconolactonase
MIEALAGMDLPWAQTRVCQVDERMAPDDRRAQNVAQIHDLLVDRGVLDPDHLLAMPMASTSLDAAADAYSRRLHSLAGSPPILDLVQLGIGADGHTASLLPDDPAAQDESRDVVASRVYQGYARLSLSLAAINRARCRIWIVVGADKRRALQRLLKADTTIPAGRVTDDHFVIVADRAAYPTGM